MARARIIRESFLEEELEEGVSETEGKRKAIWVGSQKKEHRVSEPGFILSPACPQYT